MKESDSTIEAGAGAVGLNGKFEILPDQRLPEFDSPPVSAYAARPVGGSSDRLFGLICDPTMPPRNDIMRSLRRIRHPGLLSMVDEGVVDWHPDARRCQAIIMERPAGAPLMPPEITDGQPMPQDRLTQFVLIPLVGALQELATFGLAHGSIRPENIYTGGDTAKLGQGCSGPAGFSQPMLFQTIDGGMTSPAGRGLGRHSDDMYALGVTILTLLRGGHPMAGAGDDEILTRKMASGSYTALAGGEEFPFRFLEPLRGLLIDEPTSRWDLEYLDLWLEGQHITPRHQPPQRRAQRPFVFHDEEYLACPPLAHALCRHWDDAAETVLGKDFRSWLTNSLGAESISEQYLEVTGQAAQTTTDRVPRDRMLARVLMVLDRAAPIRFKDIRVRLDGFGPLLAAVIDDPNQVRMLREIISAKLALTWFGMQYEPPGELTRYLQTLEKISPLMERNGYGFGIERCLYDLNPDLHCFSPILRRFHVREAHEIVPALEQAAQDDDRANSPIDRHIAGFIAARSKIGFTAQFRELTNASRTPGAALAILDILVRLEDRKNPAPKPALAAWLGEMMRPVVKGYHNLNRRKRMDEGIKAATRSGDLSALMRLLGDASERSRDQRQFEAATAEYTQVTALIARFTDAQGRRAIAAERIGARLAAAISTGVVGLVVLFSLFVYAT